MLNYPPKGPHAAHTPVLVGALSLMVLGGCLTGCTWPEHLHIHMGERHVHYGPDVQRVESEGTVIVMPELDSDEE